MFFEALKRKDGKVIFFLDSVVKVFGCSACCLTKNFCLMTICIQKVQVFGWQVKFLDKKNVPACDSRYKKCL